MLNIFGTGQSKATNLLEERVGQGDKVGNTQPKTVRQITAPLEQKLKELFDFEDSLHEDNAVQSELIRSASTRIADNNAEIARAIKAREALTEIFNEMNG
ncbi:hypothetical protein [Acinetobacter nosocomialis]|uniref:hypothetical protein n=1 Tax=Acinetobacter nosocomialis TaxID=106654 RepID=UPI0033B47ECD